MEERKRMIRDLFKNSIDKFEEGVKNIHMKRRTCIERLFKKVPDGVNIAALRDVPYFVEDATEKLPSFKSILYCSLDYQILIMMILVYTFIDLLIQNTIVGLLVAYAVEKCFYFARQIFGERNLGQKTLTDGRFLL